jgi:hypothetical protein
VIRYGNLRDLVPKYAADTGPMEIVKQERIAKSRLHGEADGFKLCDQEQDLDGPNNTRRIAGRPKIMPQDTGMDSTRVGLYGWGLTRSTGCATGLHGCCGSSIGESNYEYSFCVLTMSMMLEDERIARVCSV